MSDLFVCPPHPPILMIPWLMCIHGIRTSPCKHTHPLFIGPWISSAHGRLNYILGRIWYIHHLHVQFQQFDNLQRVESLPAPLVIDLSAPAPGTHLSWSRTEKCSMNGKLEEMVSNSRIVILPDRSRSYALNTAWEEMRCLTINTLICVIMNYIFWGTSLKLMLSVSKSQLTLYQPVTYIRVMVSPQANRNWYGRFNTRRYTLL